MADKGKDLLKTMKNPWTWVPAGLVALVLVAAFFLIILTNRSAKDALLLHFQRELQVKARIVALVVESYFHNIEIDLSMFSRLIALESGALVDLEKSFKQYFLLDTSKEGIKDLVEGPYYRISSLGFITDEAAEVLEIGVNQKRNKRDVKKGHPFTNRELKKELFHFPRTTGKVFVTGIVPYNNGRRLWMSHPVLVKGDFKGVLVAGIDPGYIYDRAGSDKLKEHGFLFLMDQNGKALAHLDPEFIGRDLRGLISRKDISVEDFSKPVPTREEASNWVEHVGTYFLETGGGQKELIALAPVRIGGKEWLIGTTGKFSEIAILFKKHRKRMTVISLLLLLSFGCAGLLIGAYIIRSKRELDDIISKTEYLEKFSKSIEDLKGSEEKYRMLFDHAAFPISLTDVKTGKLVAFNTRAHAIHGYSYEEFKDLTFADLEIVNSPSERPERLKRLLDKGSINFETRHRTKDGRIIDLLVSSVVVELGGRSMIQNIGADITDLKKTQDALRKSEVRFRHLVEYIPDSLFLHDMDGKILDVNQSACESLGYTSEELIGLHIQDIDENFIMEKHLKSFKAMDPGRAITFEGLQKRKDGTTLPAEIRLLIFESGDRQLMLALVRNIAARKKAEEDRKQLETQLAYAQKMQAIGTLAGGIAHNFNNLLMGVQGNISLMFIDKGPDDSDYARLKNIQKLIDSGAKLTGQLLGYAREGKYETRPISLNLLIKETSSTFGAARKEISIHYDLDDKLYGINADQGQIEQTLLNLYVNAAEAMPGGGDLFLKTANASHKDMKGKEYTPKPGKYVRLIISDTGTGIDRRIIERIFDPFFTTKGFAQGTGLGLASVYGIIKSHGGYIEVDSEKGQGTEFVIYLPATKEVIKEEKEQSDEILAGKETVLLVDDEELVIEAGQQMLENMGYDVLLATNGKEALDRFMEKEEEIDIVLLDMVMPDMGGGETYDKMKEIKPNVKVLLSSGYGLDGEAKEILGRGCNGFIQKPFKMKELSEKVREVLAT